MKKSAVLTALAGLAQETRLDVFRLLVEAGPEGLPAGRIAGALALPAASLSFHLKALRHAGLVHFRRTGRSLVYSADFDTMIGLVGFLTDNCCGGDPEACAPAAAPARKASQGRRRS